MLTSFFLSILMSFGPGPLNDGTDAGEPTAPPSHITLNPELTATPGPQADVSGTWRITQAGAPDGSGAYTGTVTLQKLNGDVYSVKWQTSAGNYVGVGILDGANLYIGWGIDADFGVAVYTQNGGTLAGKWATSDGTGTTGTETVTLAGGNLVGTHAIVGGNPGGAGQYRGTLAIAQTGATYSFKWTTGSTQYSGVGIKVGNTLVVGWGMGANHGVVHYAFSGNAATGKWAVPGMPALATENIAR